MKTIILLLFTILSYSQEVQVYAGLDMRNTVTGSSPTDNKPALDLNLGIKMFSKNNIGMGFGGEIFDKIGYYSVKVSGEFQHEITDNLYFTFSLEPTLIIRKVPETIYKIGMDNNGELFIDYTKPVNQTSQSGHFTVGANIGGNYFLNDHFGLGVNCNVLPRTDLNYLYGGNHWVFSNYFNLIYRL